VFADDKAVGQSLMIVVPSLLVFGAAIALLGWRPLAAKINKISS
jgi:hypothetical protein